MSVSFSGLGWLAPVIPVVIAAIMIFTIGMDNTYMLLGIAFLISSPITFLLGKFLNRGESHEETVSDSETNEKKEARHQLANMPMQYAGIFWAVAGVVLIVMSLL
jgi:hypothetical protein